MKAAIPGDLLLERVEEAAIDADWHAIRSSSQMRRSPGRKARISGEERLSHPTVLMLELLAKPASHTNDRPSRRIVIRASRPSLIDLRFKGDPWVVDNGSTAAVCLGDYPMAQIAASPFDLPTLNRALAQVRLGQARRNYMRQVRKLTAN